MDGVIEKLQKQSSLVITHENGIEKYLLGYYWIDAYLWQRGMGSTIEKLFFFS